MTITINDIFSQSNLDVRLANDNDEAFLESVFFSTREDLLQLNLPATMLELLLRQQYKLQQQSYSQRWPGVQYHIVYAMGLPVGKFMLAHAEKTLHLVDIALLPQARGKGMGSALIKAIQMAARQHCLAIKLAVENQNWRARKLYEALGFSIENASATHEFMRWNGASDVKNNSKIPEASH